MNKKLIDIFANILMVVAVAMMAFTIVSVSSLNKEVFGYKTYVVLSDSMSATDFDAGDIIFTKSVDTSTLKEGDIISYISENADNYGEVVTHKIKTIQGELFTTYGTTTGAIDSKPVRSTQVLGKYQFAIPKVGYLFNFIKTVPGYILCILTPFMILIGLKARECYLLFKQYRKEQMDVIKTERESLEKEREETRRMMEELQEMKKQLEEKRE